LSVSITTDSPFKCGTIWGSGQLFTHASAQEIAEYPAPTIEDILSDVDFWSPELSPSGTYLAGVRRIEDQDFLITTHLREPELEPKMINLANAYLNWVEWVSDDRLLISVTNYAYKSGREYKFMGRDDWEKYGDRPIVAFERIISSDRNGENGVSLFGSRPLTIYFAIDRVISFLPDDDEHILATAWSMGALNIYKVNVITGVSKLVENGAERTVAWYVDKEGIPAFRFDSNRRGTVIDIYAREERDNGKIKWRKIREFRIKRNRKDASATDFTPLYPGPTEATYYVAARPEDKDKTGIYLYDLEKDTFVETLSTHDELDIENAFFNRETREFQGVYYYDDRLVIEYEDKEVQAHIGGLNQYFGADVNVIPHMSNEAGDIWLLQTIGPTDSGTYHIYDLNKTESREIGYSKLALQDKTLGSSKVINYVARDGLALTGYLTRPQGLRDDQVAPLIMLPHGGPEDRDILTFDSFVQLLVAHGYQVFQPNFRGSSGYGVTFANLGRGEWGQAMQDDLDDGFDHLVSEGLVDSDQACIVGASYGGYAALAAATLTPDLYRCAVSIAGVSDLVVYLNWDRKEEGRNSASYQYWVNHIGDPRKDKAALQAVSPSKLAERVKAPILLIHGTDDDVVPLKQSEIMAKALRKAKKYYKLVELEDSTHSYRSDEDQRLEYETILAFLGTHLPVAED
jgi:dipeptidyl aminopeptidase/acylaminoacyl peptidase